MVDDVSVVGDDASFEPFDGEGKDVGDDECFGSVGIGTTEEEAHYFDGVASFFGALFYSGVTVCHLW